jgi:hypothetical protein
VEGRIKAVSHEARGESIPITEIMGDGAAWIWIEEKLVVWLTDHVGDVLGALKRRRPHQPTVREGLRELLGYVENNWGRLHYKEPWYQGLAVGSGSVEGACKHVILAQCKRPGMRWKPCNFLNVLELRLRRLNTTLEAFWANYGLKTPAVLYPTPEGTLQHF